MTRYEKMGYVRNIKNQDIYEVLLDKLLNRIVLQNTETKEIIKPSKKNLVKIKTYYRKELQARKNKLIQELQRTTHLVLLSLILTIVILKKTDIVTTAPKIFIEKEILNDQEAVIEEAYKYIDKNSSLTEEEKIFIKSYVGRYLEDNEQNMTMGTILNVYDQLATMKIDYKEPEEEYVAGRYLVGKDQIIIYKDSPGTMLHENIHCILDNGAFVKNSFGISLEEGYCGAVENYYTGQYSYLIENELLNIIARIIGKEELLTCLSNHQFDKIASLLADKTGLKQEECKKIIKDLDNYLLIYQRNDLENEEILQSISEEFYELGKKAGIPDIENDFIFNNILTREYILTTSFISSDDYSYIKVDNEGLRYYLVNEQNKYSEESIKKYTAEKLLKDEINTCISNKYLYSIGNTKSINLLLDLIDSEVDKNNLEESIIEKVSEVVEGDPYEFIIKLLSNPESAWFEYKNALLSRYFSKLLTIEEIANISDALNIYQSIAPSEEVEGMRTLFKIKLDGKKEQKLLVSSNLKWEYRELNDLENSFVTKEEELYYLETKNIESIQIDNLYCMYYEVGKNEVAEYSYLKDDVSYTGTTEVTELEINGIKKYVIIMENSYTDTSQSYSSALFKIKYSTKNLQEDDILSKKLVQSKE